jgi:hypothetical protein
MAKFVSDKIWNVIGFWNGKDPGDDIHGKILEYKAPTHEKTAGGFIIQLTKDCKTVLTPDGEVITAKKGDRVGLNRYTAFVGMEREEYRNKQLDAKITGFKDMGEEKNAAFQFDVDIT